MFIPAIDLDSATDDELVELEGVPFVASRDLMEKFGKKFELRKENGMLQFHTIQEGENG